MGTCCLTHLVAEVHQQHGLWKTDECNKHLGRGENRQTETQRRTEMKEKQRLWRKKEQGLRVSHCLRRNGQTEGNTTMANVSVCVFQTQALLCTIGWFLFKLTGFCYMKVTNNLLENVIHLFLLLLFTDLIFYPIMTLLSFNLKI